MKAIRILRSGDPDVLELVDVEPEQVEQIGVRELEEGPLVALEVDTRRVVVRDRQDVAAVPQGHLAAAAVVAAHEDLGALGLELGEDVVENQFKEILENAVSRTQPGDTPGGTGRFAQVAGLLP